MILKKNIWDYVYFKGFTKILCSTFFFSMPLGLSFLLRVIPHLSCYGILFVSDITKKMFEPQDVQYTRENFILHLLSSFLLGNINICCTSPAV